MKLIQLNTWQGKLDSNLYNFIKAQNADILMLQEVLSSPENETYYFDELQKIIKKSALNNVFFSPLMGHRFENNMTYYGNAILSRFDFNETYEEFTHLEYNDHWNAETDSDEMKLFQHAIITSPGGKEINVINYHGFNAHGVKLGNSLTEKHCQQIADYLVKLDGPKILSGDFNLAPNSKSLQPINALLKNLCLENKITTTRNQLSKTDIVVDYIWVSDDITVNHFKVLPDLVSDHAALLLEFDV